MVEIPPDQATAEQKRLAWRAVEEALALALIVQGRCEWPECGKFHTEAHHDDYAESKRLEVRWFCRRHHLKHHRSHEHHHAAA